MRAAPASAGLLATALVLGLAARAGSGARGPDAVAGWVVVQTDGARVVFASPPARKGTRLVGRLFAGGALVSLPLARVDEAATRSANEPETPRPVPAPKTASAPRPFETPPLGDLVKLRAPAGEARAHIEGARKGTPAPPADPAAAAPPPLEEPTDLRGRGEGYWRQRADGQREALADAAAETALAEAALEAAERAWLGAGDAEQATFVLNVLAARERAERARADHRREEGRWETLQEEARKAGAFPGWLR